MAIAYPFVRIKDTAPKFHLLLIIPVHNLDLHEAVNVFFIPAMILSTFVSSHMIVVTWTVAETPLTVRTLKSEPSGVKLHVLIKMTLRYVRCVCHKYCMDICIYHSRCVLPLSYQKCRSAQTHSTDKIF